MLKSSTAKTLYRVFGMTDKVTQFDKHHVMAKDFKNEKSEAICRNLIIHFSEKLLEVKLDLKEQFREWETSYFIQNNREPYPNDLGPEQLKIRKRFQLAEKLIKHFAHSN